MKFAPPVHHTPGHVLAELYHRCRAMNGIDVWIDYSVRTKWNRRYNVNMAVVLAGEIICLVWMPPRFMNVSATAKRSRLLSLEVPLLIIKRMNEVPETVERIRQFVSATVSSKRPGIELELP